MEIPLTYHGYLMKNPHGNHQHQHAPRRPMAVANQRISALPWPRFFLTLLRLRNAYPICVSILFLFCKYHNMSPYICIYIFTFIVIVVMIYAYIYIHTLFIYFIMLTICVSVYIYIYIRIGPGAVTVTTTGQHKRSTTKMLQIGFISNKKSQHIATFKSGEIRSFGDDSPY